MRLPASRAVAFTLSCHLIQTFEVLSLTSKEIMVEYSIVVLLVFCCLVIAPPTVEECAVNSIIANLGESHFYFADSVRREDL